MDRIEFIENMPTSEIEKVYKKLAKKADTRLLRLESYAKQEYYSEVLRWSYSVAMYDIHAITGDKGTSRFNRKLTAKDEEALRWKYIKGIQALYRFLDAPTSTKKGIIQIYKSRVDTINKRYSTDFKWQDFATFIESDAFRIMEQKLASSTTLKTIGKMTKKDLKEMIEKAKKSNVKSSDFSLEMQQVIFDDKGKVDKASLSAFQDLLAKWGLTDE